jgi:Membrane bound beta barrel domain (DUF5777)
MASDGIDDVQERHSEKEEIDMHWKNLQPSVALFLACGFILSKAAFSQTPAPPVSSSVQPAKPVTATDLGVSFIKDSTSQVVVERDGKKYVIDVATHDIREAASESSDSPNATSSASQVSVSESQVPKPEAATPTKKSENKNVYTPGDDLVFNVPTGRALERHGFYVNFTHRFPYEAAFTGTSRGGTLLGLDDFAIPSFGLRYGITSKLSVMAMRSPSIIGRPIELMVAYNFLDERHGNPINAAFRFSVDGQNDFEKNFSENFELIFSRSVGRRAQFYAVPTLSLHARPLLGAGSIVDSAIDQPCHAMTVPPPDSAIGVRPCANVFSIGTAVAVDIRPTVALVAEAIPTLANGRDLGIHRPSYGFGIQKKIWRHAFTFGFTNGPSTIVSQRAGTRATFLGDPSADKPGGLFVGFDINRQIF